MEKKIERRLRCFNCGRWNVWDKPLHPDCLCGDAQYTSKALSNQPIEEKWKRENCGHDVMKCLTEVEHLHKEIDILADYLLKHHHKEICGSAVDTAINIISGIPNLLEQERKHIENALVGIDFKENYSSGLREEWIKRSDVLSIINK